MNRRSFIRTITASGVSLFLPKVIESIRRKRPRPFVKFLGVSDYIEVTHDNLYFNKELNEEDVSFLLSNLFAVNPQPRNSGPPMMICGEKEYQAIRNYAQGLPA